MNKNKIILIALYAILIIGFVYLVYSTKGFGIWKSKTVAGESKDGEWQAVFLTNGQVYFGHLSGTNSKYATLKEIYYLQVQKAVQPADQSQAQDQKVTLVKLGNELHAPMDEMKIDTNQIIFWENMKKDGKVVQAIDKYIKEGPTKTE